MPPARHPPILPTRLLQPFELLSNGLGLEILHEIPRNVSKEECRRSKLDYTTAQLERKNSQSERPPAFLQKKKAGASPRQQGAPETMDKREKKYKETSENAAQPHSSRIYGIQCIIAKYNFIQTDVDKVKLALTEILWIYQEKESRGGGGGGGGGEQIEDLACGYQGTVLDL
jgi:hypothetical protein